MSNKKYLDLLASQLNRVYELVNYLLYDIRNLENLSYEYHQSNESYLLADIQTISRTAQSNTIYLHEAVVALQRTNLLAEQPNQVVLALCNECFYLADISNQVFYALSNRNIANQYTSYFPELETRFVRVLHTIDNLFK